MCFASSTSSFSFCSLLFFFSDLVSHKRIFFSLGNFETSGRNQTDVAEKKQFHVMSSSLSCHRIPSRPSCCCCKGRHRRRTVLFPHVVKVITHLAHVFDLHHGDVRSHCGQSKTAANQLSMDCSFGSIGSPILLYVCR